MARLDARWDNFWHRGQVWHHFDLDYSAPGPQGVAPALIDQTAVIYDPFVQRAQLIPLIDQTAVLYDPVVQRVVPQTVEVDLITQLGVVYEPPWFFHVVVIPLIDQSGLAYEATVTQPIQPVCITSLGLVYEPTLSGIYPDVIDRTGWLFDLVGIFLAVPAPLIDQSGVVYDMTFGVAVGEDLELDYGIGTQPGSSLTLDYRISDQVGVDLSLDWAIHDDVGKSLTLDWANENTSTPGVSLTIDYAISSVIVTNILYDGMDITPTVLTRDCTFATRAGGSPGSASFYIREAANSMPIFTTGKTLDLRIDGDWVWRGFVTRVSHEYPFAYDDTDGVTPKERYIHIEGTDINVLFEKRIVFNQTTPTAEGPTYNADNTPDTTAITELVSNWLDLSSDGLDVTSMIENVGTINTDQPAYPFAPSWKWGQAMRSIAALPGAIFYIDPDKRLVYTDVDTPNAPFALSDTDEAFAAVGYREMRFTADGTNLVNDYLAWGVSGANPTPIFLRTQDSGSISTHGRWQDSTLRSDIYKPSTLSKVSTTWVNGSPQNKRGHKDDKPRVVVRTFTPGFRVAQKIQFISHAHDIDDVYPVRMLTISFAEGFTTPVYVLELSHEIDMLSFADAIRLRRFPNVIDPIIRGPGEVYYPGIVIDSFSRTILDTYHPGVANSGYTPGWMTGEQVTWTNSGSNTHMRVQNGAGILMNKVAQYPQLYDTNWQHAETTVPQYAVGGDHDGEYIDLRNLLIRFRIGRDLRVYESFVISTTDGVMPWQNPGGATDHIVSGFESDANYGTNTTADHPAYVASGAQHFSITMGCRVPPGGQVLRHAFVGKGFLIDGAWYGSNGGGMVPWPHRYANSTHTAEAWLDYATLSRSDDRSGLRYISRAFVKEYVFIGTDVASCIFNQKVWFQISAGGASMTFDRSEGLGGYTGYTDDGLSATTLGMSTTAGGGTPQYSWNGSHTIEPDRTYFLRWHRPNDHGSFLKVWLAGDDADADYDPEKEPDFWLAGDQRDGWDNPNDTTISNRGISITSQLWPWQSYNLEIDHIASLGGEYGYDDLLPTTATRPTSGLAYVEKQIVSSTDTLRYTLWPYLPGTLTLWCNGCIQRKGLDFEETNPLAGTYTLLFTPSIGDKIIVRYFTA